MNAITEYNITKMTENSILIKGQLNDLLFGIKELSGKMDTLIALKQVELSRQQPPPELQSRTK